MTDYLRQSVANCNGRQVIRFARLTYSFKAFMTTMHKTYHFGNAISNIYLLCWFIQSIYAKVPNIDYKCIHSLGSTFKNGG